MNSQTLLRLALLLISTIELLSTTADAFAVRQPLMPWISSQNMQSSSSSSSTLIRQRRMLLRNTNIDSSSSESSTTQVTAPSNNSNDDEDDLMASAMMDASTRLAMEKARRANELRAQEVYMTKSTGKHTCSNCEWEYDETKGDSMMIGGTIPAGTKFVDLPSNWRCPVCRASKDSFRENVIEIAGFAVNQGYGFGTNSWTGEQKSRALFGGLGFLFLLMLSGYALS